MTMAGRGKFWVAGLMIVAAVILLIATTTRGSAHHYLTVAELQEMGAAAAGRGITVSGAVVGDSIQYDAALPRVTFTIAHTPLDPGELQAAGGLEAALRAAVHDPASPRLEVVYADVLPYMLRDEAQAVVRGRLAPDGSLVADQVLLKCPSRYDEADPASSAGRPDSGVSAP